MEVHGAISGRERNSVAKAIRREVEDSVGLWFGEIAKFGGKVGGGL